MVLDGKGVLVTRGGGGVGWLPDSARIWYLAERDGWMHLYTLSDAQVAGSIISYLRRYSLASMLCMYSDQDTDGNQPPAKAQPEQPKVELPQDFEPKMSQETAGAVMGSDGIAYGKKDPPSWDICSIRSASS